MTPEAAADGLAFGRRPVQAGTLRKRRHSQTEQPTPGLPGCIRESLVTRSFEEIEQDVCNAGRPMRIAQVGGTTQAIVSGRNRPPDALVGRRFRRGEQ